ncbi:MAG: hypothetical protein WC878_06520 [Candidatus Paceibacterota bacterium]|jgi:hypothetical protein
MALTKLPEWLPEVGAIVEITPIKDSALPGTEYALYRGKVISIAIVESIYFEKHYEIHIEGYNKRILQYTENSEILVECWFFYKPINLNF